jgi:hypothetical protein
LLKKIGGLTMERDCLSRAAALSLGERRALAKREDKLSMRRHCKAVILRSGAGEPWLM